MAKDKGHQMIQTDDFKGETQKLEKKYQSEGYTVYLRDLTEIRDSMRDVGIQLVSREVKQGKSVIPLTA